MDLKNISNHELCLRMEKLVRSERKITHLILMHILEIESRRLYADLGFDGMFSYLTKGLGYSESGAYRRLQSARILKQVPSAADKLETGALNLSQLTQVQKCLKEASKLNAADCSKERTQALLEKIENKNTFQTEKVLAIEFNKAVQLHEVVKPQGDESVRLEITFSKKQYEELEQARALLSHVCPDGTWSEVLAVLAQKFNQSKLGKNSTQGFAAKQEKAVAPAECMDAAGIEKVEAASSVKSGADEGTAKTKTGSMAERKYLSVKIRRDLFAKAQGCCEYRDAKSGRTCGSTYQLQVDHIYPRALGGGDEQTNLRILCRSHNLLMANRLGISKR
ncbi:HNH endonuclease [Bdellovibrio svalbardensis]|uniref:HNH endonuclease n=1 Tax=Bdellovibrio svalbardensis TaxID=2972972 RepID=A0ABT6DGA5_9BACT|nr:HNH endonuclease signature motif containing protein [Bdellovibrio svalbardensis]MDG0815872.1 HNH endonuclease [Bdellovibrio svalbardensis]